jgi:hypothetical protein
MSKTKYVYHGSPYFFETANPSQHLRTQREGNKQVTIFDDISFHCAKYKWIALAYTYDRQQTYVFNKKLVKYNISINLYKNEKYIFIHGFETLQKSLKKLYGNGGYVYSYDAKKFFHTEGLGTLEVITQKAIKPLIVKKIKNPVSELRKLGVKFMFIDLAKKANTKKRRKYTIIRL